MAFETPIQQRLRIIFGKQGPLKYTGHLDTARLWERVLRRADLPILYSQGFNARPRIQLASPLPLGITSECEIVDVMLHTPLSSLADLKSTLQSVSPEGLRILDVIDVPARAPTLQTLVRSAEYRITFLESAAGRGDAPHRPGQDTAMSLQEKIGSILSAGEILQEKKGKRGKTKQVNLRSLIHDLRLDDDGSLIAHLACGDQGNLRPDALLEQMGLAGIHCDIHRFRLILEDGDTTADS